MLLLHVLLQLHQVNQLSESFLGSSLLPYHHPPTKHSEGEYFGVEYLYRQRLEVPENSSIEEMAGDMDEGFVDDSTAAPSISEHLLTVGVGAAEDEEDEKGEEDEDENDEDEPEDEVRMHVWMNCKLTYTISG